MLIVMDFFFVYVLRYPQGTSPTPFFLIASFLVDLQVYILVGIVPKSINQSKAKVYPFFKRPNTLVSNVDQTS